MFFSFSSFFLKLYQVFYKRILGAINFRFIGKASVDIGSRLSCATIWSLVASTSIGYIILPVVWRLAGIGVLSHLRRFVSKGSVPHRGLSLNSLVLVGLISLIWSVPCRPHISWYSTRLSPGLTRGWGILFGSSTPDSSCSVIGTSVSASSTEILPSHRSCYSSLQLIDPLQGVIQLLL